MPLTLLPLNGERGWEIEESWLELVVQDNAEKRAMHLQAAVVLDEAQLSEFVHEEVHP